MAAFLLSLAYGAIPADALSISRRELVADLQHGGYVILMRHAESPREIPAMVNDDNVNHERQLDETGIHSAQAMGNAMRSYRIPIGRVLSSPTYRALQTLKYAQLGPVTVFTELGDGGLSMHGDEGGARAAWLLARAAEVPVKGRNTVIVTHFPNIVEAYPQTATDLADGEALILKPDGRSSARLVTRLKIDEWTTLDR